jgi:transcription antitermination factor NusG
MADQALFTPGEMVKVVSGPFATFTGNIREVNQSRQMLLVIVQLEKDNSLVKAGTGGVPIELKFQEVVKVTS